MVAAGIRETIAAAVCAEQASDELRHRLEEQLPRIREKLILPEQEPLDALMGFITRYVESVPTCIQLVTAVSKRMGFHAYAAPFLHMAEDYFLRPPEELPVDGGLEALLDEAFLAHRLMEEVNDHHIRHLQRPLLPVDMTEANIIVHHLLGDPLATRLEQLVQYAAAQLLHREQVWQQVRSLPGSDPAAENVVSSASVVEPAGEIRLRLSALS